LEEDAFFEKYIILSWCSNTLVVSFLLKLVPFYCSFGTELFIRYVNSYRLLCSYWHRIVYLVCTLIPFVVYGMAREIIPFTAAEFTSFG